MATTTVRIPEDKRDTLKIIASVEKTKNCSRRAGSLLFLPVSSRDIAPDLHRVLKSCNSISSPMSLKLYLNDIILLLSYMSNSCSFTIISK